MTSYCLIIFSLIFPLPSIGAQTSSSTNESISFVKMVRKFHERPGVSNVESIRTQRNATSLQISNSEVTTDYRSRQGQGNWQHRHHLINLHGILNIIGWGTLLPVGMIVARYFRKFPMQCDEWYPLHVLCQILGYILGTMGWLLGFLTGNSSKQYTVKAHRVLSIIIFTLATIQMFAVCLQPKRENEYRKCWEIYHHLLGYALIGLSVANIFEGIQNQSHAERWRWVYGALLLILALIAIALEINRWIKSKSQQQIAFASDIYTSTQI